MSNVHKTPGDLIYRLPEGDLQQGDVILRDGILARSLNACHPRLFGPECSHVMVLTSSCDLVLRQKDQDMYEARFLTLAPVYPLETILEQQLELEQSSIEQKAEQCSDRTRNILTEFLKKLINNNIPDYFFLPQSTTKDIQFPVHSCAILRQAFPIKLDYNYLLFQQSRIVSLTDVFVAKLGFLVGEMYSRVATDDVIPAYMPDFKSKVQSWLSGLSDWEDSEVVGRAITSARKQNRVNDLLRATREEVRYFIAQYSKEHMLERAVKQVISILEKQNLPICEQQKANFAADLQKDDKFRQFIK
jgi:hypothetical protein